MTAPCPQRNPLTRAGLTQDGRVRAELAVDHFRPDERDLSDLVLFGQRFARHIRYYDAANKAAGDWTAFFESDVTASLAALAELPVEPFRTFQADLENWLRAEALRDPAQLAAHAKLIFHLPLALLQIAASHHAKLPEDHPFARALVELAWRELEPLSSLIGWYKGATSAALAANKVFDDTPLNAADYNVAGLPGDPRVRLSSTIADAIIGRPALRDNIVAIPLLARLSPGGWTALFDAAAEDTSPYLDAVGSPHQRYEQIYDALDYNLLAGAVKHIYQSLARIRRDAVDHLTASLEAFAGHEPHYGLWLAFLQLFQHARDELNTFTGRHLDFYFREVLRLSPRAPVPDNVHLLFELAKGRETHLLPAGTLFRAGKDALGKPVSYALESDIVVNRGRVAELRGLQVDQVGTGQIPQAALVVRSRDGLGEVELPKDDPSWPPFGPPDSPEARIGFAVADRKLFMREGNRTITLRAQLEARLASTNVAPRWIARLTGAEGWFELAGVAQIATLLDNDFDEPGGYEPTPRSPREKAMAEREDRGARDRFSRFDEDERGGKGGRRRKRGSGDDRRRRKPDPPEARPRRKPSRPVPIIEIVITLGPDDPPIVPLDAKLHGSDHPSGLPMLEIQFDFAAPGSPHAFAVLRDVVVEQVTLQTKASGLRQLMLVAGGGAADPAKPFPPFGAQPRAGASLIVGSSEIFSKPIEAWTLKLDWAAPYGYHDFFWKKNASHYNGEASRLAGGEWTSDGIADIDLGETNAVIPLRGPGARDPLVEQAIENPPFDAAATGGFIRFRLPDDFGHAAYVGENTRALVALARNEVYVPISGVNTVKPDPNKSHLLPRTPYDPVIAQIQASYETLRQPVERFSLLHPFGISAGSGRRLFPGLPFEGALLLGIADFDPPARLTLLIQVADGSGNPLKKPPELAFAFLSGDRWLPFELQDVDDKTVNFAGSGILGLNVPEEADTSHGVLPSGLHWLRIAAPRDSDALNRLISIDAQAARARFADAGNDPQFLATPLPAGTIAKLAVPDLAVKKVMQPYSSFGGRPLDAADAFAVRVSERLRHKDRAVTMFDYEAMVLEAFPHLYRVKCLGTTELTRNVQNVIIGDNELKPGAVTVVTVPWLNGLNARDPLRPYTDQATLTAVDAFLRSRVSPFVRLEVQNPRFEEVQVDFKVRFLPEVGDIAFYMDELNKAVIAYLTPWARPDGGEISFGGRLWKSSIIDFVEEQPKVDYVTDFRLYHNPDIEAGPGEWTPVDVELVEATTARSILVSAARHTIEEVRDA